MRYLEVCQWHLKAHQGDLGISLQLATAVMWSMRPIIEAFSMAWKAEPGRKMLDLGRAAARTLRLFLIFLSFSHCSD